MQVGIDTDESWGDATGDDYRAASAVEGFLGPVRPACGGGSSSSSGGGGGGGSSRLRTGKRSGRSVPQMDDK
jgi:hypothetical protein